MTQPDSASLNWTIEDFVNLTSRKVSLYFNTKNDKFWLIMHTKEALKDMSHHVAIYLHRAESHTTDLKVLCTILLINDKGEECYRNAIEAKFTVQSRYYPISGCLYHLNRETIHEPSSGLLPDGQLTVKCIITILEDLPKLSIDDKKITLAKSKALENYQTYLEKSQYSDVVFVVGQKQFKLHKIILSAQSSVFAAMFENDLEEAKQNRVDLIDVDVEVFETMIRFIYTGNVDSVAQYALELFVAADKYQLDSLKDICTDYLGANLSIESVANILLLADMHSEAQLKSKCIQFINNNKNITKVFATDGWKQLVNSRHELGLELYYDIANKFKNK